ncbi:MAG: cyclic nucleotide-binding domain-containing protein [Ignavibacteriaceae bacterium]|jgi:signal transduction histidine kinase|nr:cyclic nucleotide-binding domain-containing protein [Ignavibacteriaceae bacterium]
MSSNKYLDAIKENDLFRGIDLNSINFSYDSKRIIELKEGDLVYSSGQPADFVYLILDGEVKLKLTTLKHLLFKKAKEFVGEKEIIDGTARNSSALANSNCTLYKIDADVLKNNLESSENLKSRINTEVETVTEKPAMEFNIPLIAPEKPAPVFSAGPAKFDLNEFKDFEPDRKTVVDIDNIKVSHYHREPDLDDIIQEKYLKSDNQSLKSQLLDGTNDLGNWVITDTNLDKLPAAKKSSSLNNEKIEVDEIIISSGRKNNESDAAGQQNTLLANTGDLLLNAKNIVEFLLQKTSSLAGAVYIVSEDKTYLEELYQTNESIYKGKKSLKSGIIGAAARDKKIRYAVSFINDLNFDLENDSLNDFSGKTMIFIPFVDEKNELIAIAQLGTNETMFTKKEENDLKEYAAKLTTLFKPDQFPVQKALIKTGSSTDISQFAKFLLNDVKAPLLTVRHYSSILSRFDLAEEIKKVISLLSAQANKVIDLIQGTLDYAEKNSKVKLETVSFNEFMEQSLTVLSEYVESRNVKLFKKLGVDTKVKIDTRKFYVACFYISRFACDVMKSGSNIYFSSELFDDTLTLIIKDENKIIKESDIDNLFNPDLFNDNGDNIGLSLAISKFIIESMNANIKLQYNNPGLLYQISIPVSS